MKQVDYVIIGAGIVGLATAYQLCIRHPGKRILVLEKEAEVGQHQSGHNSGVLHTGIYYKPGSEKARNCTIGKELMEKFCLEHSIPFEITGKIIVATNQAELSQLQMIYERGQKNGVECRIIDQAEMLEIEPEVSGLKAIYVPKAGIVDYAAVCRKLAELIRASGGEVILGAKVSSIKERGGRSLIITDKFEVESAYSVNCAGLYCDHVAIGSGFNPAMRIVPFKGEYYELLPEAKGFCRNLIYPVPDLNFPFLGVHFTRMISGKVECGPNAILAFGREGYGKWQTNLPELLSTLSYPGFLRLSSQYLGRGLEEFGRSISKAAFVKALQRLVPRIEARHLIPAPAGIRAQAVSFDGKLVDDFLIQRHGKVLHVLNAPSPAATSSLNIGRALVEMMEQ